jgi:glutaredoxin 3
VPRIVLYTTQWCRYCRMARSLLARKGQRWEEIDVEADPARRSEMMERSGRSSVPQIWIGERHVGGFDDLAALEASGELDGLLA